MFETGSWSIFSLEIFTGLSLVTLKMKMNRRTICTKSSLPRINPCQTFSCRFNESIFLILIPYAGFPLSKLNSFVFGTILELRILSFSRNPSPHFSLNVWFKTRQLISRGFSMFSIMKAHFLSPL